MRFDLHKLNNDKWEYFTYLNIKGEAVIGDILRVPYNNIVNEYKVLRRIHPGGNANSILYVEIV